MHPTVTERRGRALRRELLLHGIAAGLGLALVRAAIPEPETGLLLRAAALPVALSLVVHGLLGALALGRAEWRRATPALRDYRRVIVRFILAFVLAAVAVG